MYVVTVWLYMFSYAVVFSFMFAVIGNVFFIYGRCGYL